MNIELKPCPFCGGQAAFDHDDDGANWIDCAQCGASTNQRYSLMEDCKPLLAEQWNRRGAQPVSAGMTALIADDAFAMTFQSMGQYRSALLSAAQRDSQPSAGILTYANQPGNVEAWRLGEACRNAKPGGDLIDHGLSLLQKLQEKGYGVVALAPSKQAAQRDSQPIPPNSTELETSADARDAALQALVNVRDCLHRINQHESAIRGTLWYSDTETLFDYIDAAIAASREAR